MNGPMPDREQSPYPTTRKLFGWLTRMHPSEFYEVLERPPGRDLAPSILRFALTDENSPVRFDTDIPYSGMASNILEVTINDIYHFTRIAYMGEDSELRDLLDQTSPLLIDILGQIALLPNDDVQTYMFVQERLAKRRELSIDELGEDPFHLVQEERPATHEYGGCPFAKTNTFRQHQRDPLFDNFVAWGLKLALQSVSNDNNYQ